MFVLICWEEEDSFRLLWVSSSSAFTLSVGTYVKNACNRQGDVIGDVES